MPVVNVNPEIAVIDDEVDIIVTDLHPNSGVTISASITYFKSVYIGYGHFFSDAHGTVHVNKLVSHGGTYSGLQPMGLFSSMRPMPTNRASPRLLVVGSVETPLPYKICVWQGHLTRDEIYQVHLKSAILGTTFPSDKFYKDRFLCQCDLKRTYLSPEVDRIPIKIDIDNEPIRGTLFVPKGNKGPFPGVIDLFGGAGGCIETRAALLAKNGFAALALAYFKYDTLKAKSIMDFEMRYFDKAIEWISQHPKVRPGGISMVGVCVGAQIVLLSAMRNESVRSIVCINNNSYMTTNIDSANAFVDFFAPYSFCQEKMSENICEIRNGFISSNTYGMPKIHRPVLNYKWDYPILFILGEEDLTWRGSVEGIIDQLKRSGKKNVFKTVIKGQGHLIEPPYMPVCVASTQSSDFVPNSEYDDIIDVIPWNWNGDYKNHGQSQLEAWKLLLRFLRISSSDERSKL